MIRFESIAFLYFLFLPASILLGQTTVFYTAYQNSFLYVTSCPTNQYYDIALLQCSACPANAAQKSSGNATVEKIAISFAYEIEDISS
jgi:hypothetical protein